MGQQFQYNKPEKTVLNPANSGITPVRVQDLLYGDKKDKSQIAIFEKDT
jgi:hypothetical protein